jgi:hypothetical protein
MLVRSKLLSAAVATAALLVFVPPAVAATQAGNQCIGNRSAENTTLFGAANAPGNPLPASVPVNGVITSWALNIVPIPSGLLSQALKVIRPTGAPNQYQVIGESAQGFLNSGVNTFQTRIPVHAGDRFGSFGFAEGQGFGLYCETTNPGDRAGVLLGNPPLNSIVTSAGEEGNLQVPIVVSVEPDADGDGFGDETQDKCPLSAAVQTECPAVSVEASKIVKKGSVVILVTVSSPAPVKVTGTVKLGGKKVELSAPKRNLAPGKLGRFTLSFPSKLKSKLEELSSRQSLKLKVVAAATNIAGVVSKDKLKVKLKGQG